ncbi:MAG: hypothetical protein GY778_00510, partial [bacterium]|nr:hypothetical protein [bacterium]
MTAQTTAAGPSAQATAAIIVSFDEASLGETCAAAVNTYGPDVASSSIVSADFGPPIITDTAEASGIGPECEFGPGSGLALLLNRPATGIRFNRYGTADVQLRRNGDPVGRTDNPSGLGGRYQRTEPSGFDEIVIRESTLNAPLRLDELQIEFPGPAVTVVVGFGEAAAGALCTDAVNQTANLRAAAESFTDFGPPLIVDASDASGRAPECEFNPGSSLTITFDYPAVGVAFDLFGGADVLLVLDGAQIGALQNVQGLPTHTHRTRPGGFDQITFTESSGFSSFNLDSLTVTFPVEGTSHRFDFSEGEVGVPCLTHLAAATTIITA